jgi:pimeloyl-ACP methyl ester carboxylesterase
LNEFVEAVGLEDQFFLGGNSQGAQMGSSYAVEYPDKVKRMILIASPAFHARIGLGNGMGRGDNSPLPFDGTEKWMRDSMERIIMNKAVIMDELITMRTNMANRDLQCFTAGREYGQYEIGDPNLLQAIDFRGRLDTITVPTIFLWGKDDVLAPVAMGYELEDVLTNMQFFFPNECGHQGQTDQPEMFNRVFLEFFRDGVVSRKAADWAGVSTRRAEKPHLIEQAVPANG